MTQKDCRSSVIDGSDSEFLGDGAVHFGPLFVRVEANIMQPGEPALQEAHALVWRGVGEDDQRPAGMGLLYGSAHRLDVMAVDLNAARAERFELRPNVAGLQAAIGLGAAIALSPFAALAQTDQSAAPAAPAASSMAPEKAPMNTRGSHRRHQRHQARQAHHRARSSAKPMTAPAAPAEAPKS